MKKIFYLYIIIILLFTNILSYAHPGRTDSNGGHYDHSTGSYHYHDGRYAGRKQSDNDATKPRQHPFPFNKEMSLIPFNTAFKLISAAVVLIIICCVVLLILKLKFTKFTYNSWDVKVFILDSNKKVLEKHYKSYEINISYQKYLDENNYLYGYVDIKNDKKTIIIVDKHIWDDMQENI